MRRLILLLLLSSASLANAQTSVYHHMADTGATWCENYTWGLCGATEIRVISIGAETTIGAHSYRQLFASGYRYCNTPPQYFTNEYRGGIREDTVARRVYWAMPNDTTSYLLYDFTLAAGDTLFSLLGNLIISSTDSVLIGTDYRKRWWLEGYFPQVDSGCYVEGIGSNFGLYMMQLQSVENLSMLYSYAEFGADLWQPDPNQYCPIITGESAISFGQPVISITPNPSEGNFILNYTGYDPTDVIVELRDISGRLLSATTINGVAEFQLPFDEAELSDGIYFLNVITPKETVTRKVIVQH